MTINKADGAASDHLASHIKECIVEADAHGLDVVAAHLDAALNALQGAGLKPSDLDPSYWPLH